MILLLKPGKYSLLLGPTSPSLFLVLPRMSLKGSFPTRPPFFFPINGFQHGYKSRSSTTNLLTALSHCVFNGLNCSKNAARFLDAVSLSFIYQRISTQFQGGSWLPKFWIPRFSLLTSDGCPTSLLVGRAASLRSTQRQYPNSVSQRPILFSLSPFIHEFPSTTIQAIKTYTYADDLTILLQHPRVEEAGT